MLSRLLAESKVDTFARTITSKVLNLIIQRIGKLNAQKRLVIGIRNLDPNREEFTLKLTVTLKRKPADRVNVAGSWIPALDVLEVNVFLETQDGLFHRTLLQRLQHLLYDTVRHEVEHSTQEKPADMYVDSASDDEESVWQDPQAIEGYFLSDEEVPAFVAGLYHQAKRARRPFFQVMDEKLAAYKAVAQHHGAVDADELDTIFRRVRRVWTQYAVQRFPKAVVS